jgi:hypothetical protein
MKIENKVLKLKVSEFIKVLNDNPDNCEDNYRINGTLISIVKKNKNRLTDKQRKWIIRKLDYIFRRNKKLKKTDYINVQSFNDILFVNECEIKKDLNKDKNTVIGFGRYEWLNN